jgi:two-component system, OmpR family, sensor histidine kinase QseC
MRSIRWRTLGLALLVSTLTLSSITYATYLSAAHEVGELFDARLAQNARLLQGLMETPLESGERDRLLTNLESALWRASDTDERLVGHRYEGKPDADERLVGHQYEGKIAFQIWEHGELRLRSANAPESPLTLAFGFGFSGYGNVRVDGWGWRVYALDGPGSDRRVLVAEREDVRSELIEEITQRALVPVIVGLPLLALLLWWAVGFGLRPLLRLAGQIGRRDPRNLQPVAMDRLPRELQTIVAALNHLLDRIQRLRAREKQFISVAAHELRTPLAVLYLHSQNALNSEDASDRRESLMELKHGVQRATRLVSQLLTLARLEPEQDGDDRFQQVDVLREVREACAKLRPLATERRQRIRLLTTSGSDWRLQAEPGAIEILVQNLLGNALNHSPPLARITVSLTADDDRVSVQVDDEGPGIPLDERPLVLRRFHRAGPGAGAGLGLSIVERLVQRHGGDLSLSDAPAGGLRVTATLPRRSGASGGHRNTDAAL